MKYILEIDELQAQIIKNACDMLSRLYMGSNELT